MIVGPLLVSSKKLTFFVSKKWSWVDWVFSYSSISGGCFQPTYIYNKTNQTILRYTKKFLACWHA